jgi:hypothetical protein
LEYVEVNLVIVNIVKKFKVIKIIDKKDTYPIMLSFKWDNGNKGMINLKMGNMLFEVDEIKVIHPIEFLRGEIYTKLVYDVMDGVVINQ